LSTVILGIETSCDDTGVSIVQDGYLIKSNIIASQTDIHSQHGGIVPELASRQHIRDIMPVIDRSLEEAEIGISEIDIVAATYGPGLAGSLITGLNTAKTLSMCLNKPFYGVNHLEGHVYSAWLDQVTGPDQQIGFPILSLIASGGHTDLVLMNNHGEYELLGNTLDDAAGECFDKAARILGLGFPGGPEIQKTAGQHKSHLTLPRAWLPGTANFSFSGLKTAVLKLAIDQKVYPFDESQLDKRDRDALIVDISAAFQESVVDVLSQKVIKAASEHNAKGIIIGGGVAANLPLRERIQELSPIPTFIPIPRLCTDNGAMIASAAYYQQLRQEPWDLKLDINPGLKIYDTL
tara:strand:+ start:6413 stop:7462 length:1050 start_codon:yes stop_codon:yes gene_type:complete